MTGPLRRSRPAPQRARRLLTAVVALALLPTTAAFAAGDGGGGGPAKAHGKAHGKAKQAAGRRAHTVTLVTGDKVTVTVLGGGRKTVAVDRPDGATGGVRTDTAGGGITVVPDEARPYLASGALDRRLFDVSALIAQGLDDGSVKRLPLIATYGKRGSAARQAVPRGAARERALPSVDGAALSVGRGAKSATGFWDAATDKDGKLAGGLEKLWLDGRVEADMAESNAQIGAPKAWEAGYTGKDVKVAVLDSGVDATHPDLAERMAGSKSFIAGEDIADRNGHGTHVLSTVGGSGTASDGKEKGVAPDARLYAGKVLNDQGSGTESEVIAGMEWASRDIGAKVVSMSLGSREASDGTDPMAVAVDQLSAETGALFVIAAGNTGAPSSIGSPGAADAALTIGAVDAGDKAAPFTSQGPRISDNALKPDLSAPGVDILAARSQLTEGSGYYQEMSGTSMATPHVAGVAALLAQRHTDWNGEQLKTALMSTSQRLGDSPYTLGAGRLDAASAVSAQVTATGSADLGFYRWPYGGNEPVSRKLTYTNHGDEPVTLALADTGKAPDGVVKLADSSLTVPAHGTASTTLTGDGAKAAVGRTGGAVTASDADGKVVAHTAYGMIKEEERYTLTVRLKDRAGKPTSGQLQMQRYAKNSDPYVAEVGGSGTLKLRLAPGTYSAMSFLDVPGSHGADSLGVGMLGEPEITLDRDREITLDARTLREITARVPRDTGTRQLLMRYKRELNDVALTSTYQVPLTYDSVFAQPLKKPARGSFEYRTNWRLGKPFLDVEAGGKRLSDPAMQAGSTMLEGRRTLSVVDVGTGTPGEYAGKNVKGKAVLVRRGGGDSPTPPQLADAAQKAGAAALFVTDGEPGRLMKYFGGEDGDSPLQVATVGQADAKLLTAAASGRKKLRLEGTRFTPYVYDLSHAYTQGIPDRPLTYAPGKKELATLDTSFHAPSGRTEDGGEFRYGITDTFPVGVGGPEAVRYPAKRTDYVTADKGQRWHETVYTGPSDIEQRSGVPAYKAGSRHSLDWLKPVWHPWLGTGLGWGQTRSGNDLKFNTPGWGDSGPDHTGFGDVWSGDSMTQETAVYADGELVGKSKGSGAYAWDASPEERTYKVTTDTTMDADRWRLATKGHSEWTFRSAETPATSETKLPLLNLGYDVETDGYGDVRGGRKLPVRIFAEYVEGAADTGTIKAGTLEVSYDDGATWQSVKLKASHGKASWKGKLSVPKGADHVSLRASVTDDRGGAVKQELVRAVGVK
ncbi:S8 family serine peptidase [Streptomyces iconiensis]|uniref:S8 family serine peptidase n=1 Tax=Streptomyces iconiensis TaxID=1384038 RepID=A0ABT6ZVQ7_9ACTN|nr:S8 family serine peptidase [Streptomyces iconiensis]MDJ1133139.1 S8 family serine peptidase [Streptomyces iconiensis]